MAAKGNNLTQRRKGAEGVRMVPLWSVTHWDKRFNTVEKYKQEKILAYKHYFASELEPIIADGGDVKVLMTYDANLWTTVEKAKEGLSEGEIVSIPGGGNLNIQYHKGLFISSDNRIATSRDISVLSNKYLYYCLLGRAGYLNDCYRGVSIKHPEMARVLDLMIPLPSISNQRRIAAELDKICELKKNAETRLEKLDLLVKSRFVEMFGDVVTNDSNFQISKIEDVCDSIVDCPHTTPLYQSADTGYGCIRASIVRKDGMRWDELEYINESEYHERVSRREPRMGDIVYLREGGILGIAAIINEDRKVALGQRTMLLSPATDCVTSQFLCAAMNSSSFYRRITSGIGFSTSPHVNVADVKSFKIGIPPLSLQREFAAFVEKVDNLKDVAKKSVEQMDVLYRAKLQEYFG